MSAVRIDRGDLFSQYRNVMSRRARRATGRAVSMTESLEQRMLLSVTPSLVANRISGVAPLAVHFDATGTTSTATTLPLHEIQYDWNFGDPGSGDWSVSGKSRNTDSGMVAGHMYDQPGTYTVTLNVRDPDGSVGTQTVTINVQDPETVFSGTSTIVFSTTGNFTGAPAGALQVTTSSMATIASYAAPGKRLLLHRGETWSNASAVTINKQGPGIIGAFGSGAKPHIETSSNLFTISGRFFDMNDWRFMDLNITGVGTAPGGAFSFMGAANNVTIYRMDMYNLSGAVGAGESILDSWNQQYNLGHTLYDGTAIVDVNIDHGVGGGGRCGYFVSGKRMLFMGNRTTDMVNVEHTVRTPWLQKTVMTHSLFGAPASAKHNLKLHAPGFENLNTLGYHQYSEQDVVANNVFEGALNPWIVTVGPQDAWKDERVRDLVFENNIVRSTSSTQVAVIFWAQQVTARNNIVSMFSGDTGILIGRRGIEPVPSDDRLYNNTVYTPSGTATAINVAGATNSIVKNNLFAGTGTLVNDTGTGTVKANNLMTTSPGFASATPTAPADFALAAGSPAIEAGTPAPLWNDFGGNDRPVGAYDVGAWESPDATPIESLLLDNTSAGVTLTGAWTASTFNAGYNGVDYLHDGNTGKGTKSVQFAPTVTTAGAYEVFMWWTAASNRATNIPVDITHAGGVSTVSVNQQINGSQWVSLGTYSFAAGTAGNVLIRTTGTNGYVIADAVKLVEMPPVILDNTSAGVTQTGAWTSSTFNTGYHGVNYLHDGNTGKGTKSVQFTPSLSVAGNYEVFMWWTAASNRATNVPVDITHAGGVSTVSVNQQLNGGQWVSLGTYSFAAGTAGNVLIRTTGTNGYVIADAVKFVNV